jgi:hypothetical protein
MTNTILLLMALGVVNWIIRKVAASGAASKSEANTITRSRSVILKSTSEPEPQPAWWVRAAKAIQEAQAEASPRTSKSVAAARIGVPAAARSRSRAGSALLKAPSAASIQPAMAVVHAMAAAAANTVPSQPSVSAARPLSEVDSLISQRLRARVASVDRKAVEAAPRRRPLAEWRRGIVMAEIMGPPVSLRPGL